MPANALVQTRIDADIRDRASAVLESMGLTVSDAVRILLTRTANEGVLPIDLLANSEAYDAWFRTKVREALDDTRADIPDEQVEAHFSKRRAAARRKINEPKS
ncbi:damage-inducible protein [Mesorhizobium sp. LCM 4577]|jgi:DNA-damage-inducible protein J|uniref:Addiction module antitoxin, RelB/DinJ family n=1 Tax=Mesorhizobium plurifarium TaxID=69974 RepID=A0A090G9X6_MESPL|nr:type II toxin-antitoxin system RelB/DinJ family antitoxin [Mesorhizobium sp. LCM 4577]OHV60055.1 damage-inducible protein [Mesorhizobium sp. LCM 4577]CDX21894.1 Addiction module antitoxin, RelB/DinJ family [Mesorhizobium plurifarium]CDX33847.1 Addiction module antitoxin, RelB/DinJ family [Mesorhizobium plurifarium]CDX60121.1 Addiction module antitoxin, RelB/DinJ family [Mesorhizobium plurifarium]